MATETQPDIPVANGWIDIVNEGEAGNASLGGVAVKLMHKATNGGQLFVAWGSETAPSWVTAGDALAAQGADAPRDDPNRGAL